MRERVVVKWGGGLITKKHEMKTVRTDVLDDLARQLEACLDAGVDVVLVHGAGSFGHLKAKAYRLAEGKVNDGNLPSEMTQEEAVADVRSDIGVEPARYGCTDQARHLSGIAFAASLGEEHGKGVPWRPWRV